uniref:glycosyltransferase family 4 protein n=1 Tax=Shewanella sp. TaxID=50422 RepID=UPI0040475891
MSSNPIRLAWLATHPIQYQAPLLRAIAQCSDIDLTAIFFSDFSTRAFVDPGFGRTIEWDTPMLQGYKYEFLPGAGSEIKGIQTFQPRVGGLAKRLTRLNYDFVLVQGWQHYGMLKAAWLAKRAGLKVLMRCEATDHVSSSTGLKKLVREETVRFLLSQIDCCLAIGTRNRDFYIQRGFLSERIGFMPYCVDNDYFRTKTQSADVKGLRAQLSLESGRPVILYASKFMARKYPDQLLEAYLLLTTPRPYLIFVGEGEMRGNLEAAVQNHQLKDVRFAGFRNQGELPAFYALADIFVLPSINETWGLVINEAMNAGCAIITTDQVGSAADLVRSGTNGFVI